MKDQRNPQAQGKQAPQKQKAVQRASASARPAEPNEKGIIAWLRGKFFGAKKAPTAVQDTIPYREIFKDGICQLTDKHYNKTVTFGDINYQLAQNEDKDQIFNAYCEFLNYFDATIRVQLSFVNKYGNKKDFEKSIHIPDQDDDFNSVRREYADMMKNQLSKGNNGLVKHKYITFGIDAKNFAEAKSRLERIEADVLNGFRSMGVAAHSLNGAERLEVLHGQLHPDGKDKMHFNWQSIPASGQSTKDVICPTSFDFRDSKCFKMGNTYGAVSFIQIIAPELTDKLLNDFLNMDNAITINLHIRSIDQQEAIKTIKRKITDLDAMKIQEQMKAVRAGYDMDVIPTDIATFGDEAKNILKELQSRNERMFIATILVMNTAPTKQKLDNLIFAAAGITQKYNCALKRLDFQQEQGMISSLPLGLNQVAVQRGLTTSSTAIFVPFTTCELFMGGASLYYGLNALSNNLIMANRASLKNPNGLILGTPGAGKSFSAKREMVNVFLITNDDIIIADPEGEYFPLVSRLGGQAIKLSPTSTHYINPMDINIEIDDDDDPLTLKSDFILSLCELIVGGRDGLTPAEKTIIDRCVRRVYRDYIADPRPENMPILEDLYNLLREQEEAEAQSIATALEIYVTGSLNLFNHHTNIDLQNRLVCFDIKELGKSLKKLGMLILMDCVWQRVTLNRAAKKKTWFYIDEFHLLLKEPQTAAYSIEIWKRFRKWGGIPTGITQNVKDLLISMEVENIFENSDFVLMLNQAPGDREILAKKLGISPYQISYVSGSGPGEGLMFYGNIIIPFVDKFPKDTELYRIMTTKLDEIVDGR